MDEREVICLFEKYHPENKWGVKELLKIHGLKIKFLDDGLFREVYQIGKLPLVVKVPNFDEPTEDSIEHSCRELKQISRIQRNPKFKPLVRYLPEIFYFDKKTGIMIERKYDTKSKHLECFSNFLQNLCTDLFSNWDNDLHQGNVGLKSDGTPVLIDLGYLDLK